MLTKWKKRWTSIYYLRLNTDGEWVRIGWVYEILKTGEWYAFSDVPDENCSAAFDTKREAKLWVQREARKAC